MSSFSKDIWRLWDKKILVLFEEICFVQSGLIYVKKHLSSRFFIFSLAQNLTCILIQNFWCILTWVFILQFLKYTFDNSIRLFFQRPKFSLYHFWKGVTNYERLMRWGKKKDTSYGYLCATRCNINNIFFTSKNFTKKWN
jgi:hypothetical protein